MTLKIPKFIVLEIGLMEGELRSSGESSLKNLGGGLAGGHLSVIGPTLSITLRTSRM